MSMLTTIMAYRAYMGCTAGSHRGGEGLLDKRGGSMLVERLVRALMSMLKIRWHYRADAGCKEWSHRGRGGTAG